LSWSQSEMQLPFHGQTSRLPQRSRACSGGALSEPSVPGNSGDATYNVDLDVYLTPAEIDGRSSSPELTQRVRALSSARVGQPGDTKTAASFAPGAKTPRPAVMGGGAGRTGAAGRWLK
jgi:hypothetical protein